MISCGRLTYLGPSAEAQWLVGHHLTRMDGYRMSQRHTNAHQPILEAPGNWLLPMGFHGNCRTPWGNVAEPRQIKLLRRMISRILGMNMKSKERWNPSDEMARDVRAVREVPRLGDLFAGMEVVMRRLVAMTLPHDGSLIHPDVRASPAMACDRT